MTIGLIIDTGQRSRLTENTATLDLAEWHAPLKDTEGISLASRELPEESGCSGFSQQKEIAPAGIPVPQILDGSVLGREPVLGEQMHGHFAEVPDDPEPGHDLQRVISDVNLPPEEALARRSHKVMMVVVPALTEREQGEEPVVAAGVGGLVAARTEKMRERIDCEGVVPQQHGAQAEAPDEQRPSADQPQHDGERGGLHQVVL